MKLDEALEAVGGVEQIQLFPDMALRMAKRTRGIGAATMRELRRHAIEVSVQQAERCDIHALDCIRRINKVW